MVNPVCDLIIGNVDGVHDSPEIHQANEINVPECTIESLVLDTVDMVQPSTVQINKTLVNSAQSTVCGVMTRAQTMRQEKPRKPLRVPKVIDGLHLS